MIEYIIYYNRVYKHTCNLISQKIKGHYISVSSDLNEILIDNKIIATYEEVNSIEFIVRGYKQKIECNTKGNIYSTDIEMPMKGGE